MKNEDTGEFELVLGNKQLLSGFFIVVILFGVFFTMGYIVGRNSAPSPRQAAAAEPPVVTSLPAPRAQVDTPKAEVSQPASAPAVQPGDGHGTERGRASEKGTDPEPVTQPAR